MSVGVLIFVLVVLIAAFGALLDVPGLFVVVVCGVSADGAGGLADAVGRFVEFFAPILRAVDGAFAIFSIYSSIKCKLSL